MYKILQIDSWIKGCQKIAILYFSNWMSKAKNVFDLIWKITKIIKIIKEAEIRFVELNNKYLPLQSNCRKLFKQTNILYFLLPASFQKVQNIEKEKKSEKAFFKYLKGVHISY
jgi:hypothetical protein